MATDLPDLKPESLEDYKQAVKSLRQYSGGFSPKDGYDLRKWRTLKDLHSSRRARIKRYWQTARDAETKGMLMRVVRPRNKKNLKALQQYSPLDYQKDFKVAFVQMRADEKIVYGKKDKKTVVKKIKSTVTGIQHINVPFDDRNRLIRDPKNYLQDVVDTSMTNNDVAIVINGENFMFGRPFNKKAVVSEVLKLMNTYDNPEKNNYYGNWLDGLKVTKAPTFKEALQETEETARIFTQVQRETKKKYLSARKRRERKFEREMEIIEKAREKAAKIRKAKGL